MDNEELYKFILDNKQTYRRILKAHNIDEYTRITEHIHGVQFAENAYLLCNNMYDIPKCKCGDNLRFINVVDGYVELCGKCVKQQRKDNSKAAKLIQQQQKHAPICELESCNNSVSKKSNGTWGMHCSTKCKGIHNSLKSRDKAKATMMENYGVEHALQSEAIIGKMKESNIEKYGVSNQMLRYEIQDKIRHTNMVRYGVDNISKIPSAHSKKMQSLYSTHEYHLPSGKAIRIQGYEDKLWDLALLYYTEDMFEFNSTTSFIYNGDKTYYPDRLLKPSNEVLEVKSVYTFYKDYYKNIDKSAAIVNLGYSLIFCIYNDKGNSNYIAETSEKNLIREVLNDTDVKEHIQFGKYIVDFFINSLNTVIVYKSINFCNEYFVSDSYYYDMFVYFDSKGITLLVINEGTVNSAMLSSLAHKISKSNANRIYARKTLIQEVSPNDCREFLNKNHIQGYAATAIKYGLYYDGELVSLMCFSKPRKGIGQQRSPGSYELVRYATSAHVIGGASKLLSHFVKMYDVNEIYSYSDNSISNGNLYKVLGFDLELEYKQGYSYNMYGTKATEHRYSYRKSEIKRKLPYYDDSETERVNMIKNGFRRIYDCGKRTWVKNIK